MIYRRQRQQYIFAGLLAVIVVINILFYFILNRPAEVRFTTLQQSITQSGARREMNQQSVQNLQKRYSDLGKFEKARSAFFMRHFLPRKTGYSQILTELDDIVRRTGVKKTVVSLPLGDMKFGLHALSITLPVEGNYRNVVNFIRELEESDVFLLINAIDVTSAKEATQPNSAGTKISLAIGLETYFFQ